MNFELKRKRSSLTTGISFKNENLNLNFVKELKQFGKYHLYPNPDAGLQILSSQLKINAENLCVGFGSETLLKNAFLTLKYDSVQMLEYSYEMALFYNKVLNKKIIINPITFDNNTFHNINVKKLGGDLLYLVSPHSPTGINFNFEQIKKYSATFKYVIIDEAYLNPIEFTYPILENVIVLRTFSKLGGVPGLRLGYAISSTKIINKLNCIRDSYEINKESIDYLNFIFDNKNLIDKNVEELKMCYSLLKNKIDCFSLHTGNFATFQSNLFYGKKYKISDVNFTRVTLCDSLSYENLYSG